MDQKPKTTTISPQPQPPKRWLNHIKTFFDVPNPRIVRIFFISSFATFFSGIAFAFEWTFHGKNHSGFQWIIYYSLSLIILPSLIWLGLGIVMVISSSHGSMQVANVAVEEEHCVNDSAGKNENEETKNNNCERLAIVVDSDQKKCTNKVFVDKTTKLKRTVSLPLHSQVRSCTTKKVLIDSIP
ncbi:hypothetical protein ISN44_As07g006270 [Arabidopsis suecica]|uniref:Transmembrane protein n=1 Tax=Arabidopsis suecica TaxID=45249 RepID=A0A8T2BRE2_ARASU|nr:hypothetical protein ISN44_As07g006270 [Arabidopsis suecica]